MKNFFVLLFLTLNLSTLKASVLLVNNTTSGPGQYTVIDSAMTHANAGDTIYVSGSNITYASFTVKKSIAVIGPGAYGDKQNVIAAKVSGVKFMSNISNIKIIGLYLTGTIDFTGLSAISKVDLCNNFTTSYFTFNSCTNFSNFTISNNIFAVIGLIELEFYNSTGMSNILIQNNLIFGSIRSLNAANALISNNVFLNMANAFDYFGASFFSNAIIKDNIFYNANPTANTVGCTYTNNLSYSTSSTFTAMIGTGNLDNVNPEFVNVLAGAYTTAFDFHLQAGSPAIGAASNGGDIGYYGGSYHATITGETKDVPVIRAMDILNNNLPQNGNVNVKVRSTKAR